MPLAPSVFPSLQRSYEVRAILGPDATTSVPDGWAHNDAQYGTARYKDIVAFSPPVLARIAEAGGQPTLTQSGMRTWREYVSYLRANVPGLKEKVCHDYLEAYELARFSPAEFERTKFEYFFRNALVLCQEVETANQGHTES